MAEEDPNKSGPPESPRVKQNPWESIMPIVLFIVFNRMLGLAQAIVAATVWSVAISIRRYRNGHPIGKFIPIVTAGIVIRGVIGIITDSEAVYFGIGIGTKASVGIGLISTALLSRGYLTKQVKKFIYSNKFSTDHPAFQLGVNRVGCILGVALLVSSGFDIWLYNNSSVDGYLIIRFFVNWVYTTAVIILVAYYLDREWGKIIGFPGISSLLKGELEKDV